jgi:hypothetical protein
MSDYKLHILVVEDKPLIDMDLEMIIIGNLTAIVVEGAVAATKEILHEALDFAFLDVDVTLEIAEILERRHVPLVLFRAAARTAAISAPRPTVHSQAFLPGSN